MQDAFLRLAVSLGVPSDLEVGAGTCPFLREPAVSSGLPWFYASAPDGEFEVLPYPIACEFHPRTHSLHKPEFTVCGLYFLHILTCVDQDLMEPQKEIGKQRRNYEHMGSMASG